MSGTVGPRISPFINTYSLDFDGVDDYVDIGNDSSLDIFGSDFTISLWAKWGNQSSNSNGFVNFGGSTDKVLVGLGFGTEYGKISFGIGNSTTLNVLYDMGSGYNDNQWHSIICKITSGVRAVYVDGIDITNVSAGFIFVANNNTIGARSVGGQNRHFNGSIDEVSLYDRALTFEEITSISSKPTDLTPLNPIAWYRMGDNGVYKDPQWLIPSNENKDKVSNYSFQLDGINDYINCGDSDDFSFGDGVTDSPFSVSMWFNLSSFNTNNVVFSKDSGLPNREYAMGFFGTSKKLRFFIKNQGSNSQQSIDSTTLFSTDTWYNVVCTYDGSGGSNAADGMNIYVNSILETPTNVIKQTYIAMSNTTAPVNIGQYGAAASFLPAKVDEFSVYNTELLQANVDSIYKGEIPTTILGAFTYWKLGENATLLADWTIPDEVGTNDGTSVNMNFLDRVGSAPSSSNNALSFNMDLIDRVEDTPPNP